jgi:hypothetical protein
MTEGWDCSLEAQITSKMHEVVACMCVVTFKQNGDRRGTIEQIESLVLGRDFAESFNQSQFKVHLTSGDVVIVQGSAISDIESTAAGSHSTPNRKEPGRKARKARTKTMLAKKRESIAIKASKATAKARTRKANGRKSHSVRQARDRKRKT